MAQARALSLLILLSLMCPGVASACFDNDGDGGNVGTVGDGRLVSAMSLAEQSLVVGDMVFSNFQFSSFADGTFAPSGDWLFVEGVYDESTGQYSLEFFTLWIAGRDDAATAQFSYDAALAETSEHHIATTELKLTGTVATGDAMIAASQFIESADGAILASLETSRQSGDGRAFLSDQAQFGPARSIRVSSTISLVGGEDRGLAYVGQFSQSFGVLPEPATVALLSAGAVTFLARRRR